MEVPNQNIASLLTVQAECYEVTSSSFFVFKTFGDPVNEQQRYHANTFFFFLFSIYSKGLKGHTLLHVAKLKEVTERDLRSNFTCFAENSVGNATAVIQLKRKQRGKTIDGWLFALWFTHCYKFIPCWHGLFSQLQKFLEAGWEKFDLSDV